MIKIDVWIRFSDGASMRAGEMICTVFDHRGHEKGAFRYTPDYLKHPNAFALDPISLPLTDAEFETAASSGVFAVFEDSLPDNWGRPLLTRKAGLPRGQQSIPNLLLAIGGNGLGALSFSLQDKPKDQNNCVQVSLLEKLLDQAEKYEKGEIRGDSEFKHLFQAASSPGGSRPKALIKEKEKLWIAKFPSVKDAMAVENDRGGHAISGQAGRDRSPGVPAYERGRQRCVHGAPVRYHRGRGTAAHDQHTDSSQGRALAQPELPGFIRCDTAFQLPTRD